MPTTPGYNLRTPALSDTPDVPRDLGYLADDVEAALSAVQQSTPRIVVVTFTDRPTNAFGDFTVATNHGFTPTGVVFQNVYPDGYSGPPFYFMARWPQASATEVYARMHAWDGTPVANGQVNGVVLIFGVAVTGMRQTP